MAFGKKKPYLDQRTLDTKRKGKRPCALTLPKVVKGNHKT